MGHFYFEREVRTPHSEVYTIMEEDDPAGRVDLHYVPGMVHATLCVTERVTREGVQELIETLDEDLVDSLGISREEFVVHVYQGRDIGVWSKNEIAGDNHGDGDHGDQG